jgi:tetratricopeptide (TPR) repeat protein
MNSAMTLVLAAILLQAAPPQQTADDPADYVKRARRLVAEGSHDEALALYQKAIDAQPSSFEPHLGAGLVLDLKLQLGEARTHLSKALELAPDEAKGQVMNALAVSFAFEGNAKEAASFYQKIFDGQMAEANFGAAAGTANALGRVYLETGDVANARRWYQTGYESARRQPDVTSEQLAIWEFRWLHAQARIAARADRFDDAHQQVSAARALRDRTPSLKDETASWHYLAGYVELYAKNYSKAIDALTSADQEDPFVLSLLARAYEGAGDTARARETWAEVLESNAHSLQNAFARPTAVQKLK